MPAKFATGKELFELEPRGFASRDDRIQRRLAVKRVWCAIVKYSRKGRRWDTSTALPVTLSLKEINNALRQGSVGLWGELEDWELNAFEATLKDWKKRNARSTRPRQR